MNSKAQLRTQLSQLNDIELFRVLDKYLSVTNARLEKSTKEISYKCFECQCKVKNKSAVGFGRNESETLVNAVRNLMEMLVEDAACVDKVREAMADDPANYKSVGGNKDKQNKENVPIKEEILQYINLNSQKVRNPAMSGKINTEHYMSQSVNSMHSNNELVRANAYIRELEEKIKNAMAENQKLKAATTNAKGKMTVDELSGGGETLLDALQYKIHAKVRSISVQPGANFKMPPPKPPSVLTESTFTNMSMIEDKKQQHRRVPRLNLQVLPNYHGKSNKSLNQSLLQAYTKSKK